MANIEEILNPPGNLLCWVSWPPIGHWGATDLPKSVKPSSKLAFGPPRASKTYLADPTCATTQAPSRSETSGKQNNNTSSTYLLGSVSKSLCLPAPQLLQL